MVELPRGGEVAPERLFDDDASLVGHTGITEPFNHRREQRGRDSEIMCWTPDVPQRLRQRFERIRVIVITPHILEQGEKMVERDPVNDLAGLPDALPRLSAKLRHAP